MKNICKGRWTFIVWIVGFVVGNCVSGMDSSEQKKLPNIENLHIDKNASLKEELLKKYIKLLDKEGDSFNMRQEAFCCLLEQFEQEKNIFDELKEIFELQEDNKKKVSQIEHFFFEYVKKFKDDVFIEELLNLWGLPQVMDPTEKQEKYFEKKKQEIAYEKNRKWTEDSTNSTSTQDSQSKNDFILELKNSDFLKKRKKQIKDQKKSQE
jgi:hypothetical protein